MSLEISSSIRNTHMYRIKKLFAVYATVCLTACLILLDLIALRKPIFYNAAVARELVKEIWKRENLSPPSLAQIEEARSLIQKSLSWSYVRSLSLYDYAKIGIHSVEMAGFFFIGEVIGRRSLIGYNV
jgi:hypothetical protein